VSQHLAQFAAMPTVRKLYTAMMVLLATKATPRNTKR